MLIAVILVLAPGALLLGAPAKAAPNGKTWTSGITGAAALVLYAIEYQVAVKKAKGSVAQAQTVMNVDLSALAYNSPGASAVKSLSDLKTQVSTEVGSRNLGAQSRTHFEDFRSCYNQVIIGGASPTPSSSPSPSASAKASSPSPHPSTPKPHPAKKPHGSRTPPVSHPAQLALAGSSSSKPQSHAPHPSKSPVGKPSPSPSPSPTGVKMAPGCEALLKDFAPSPQPTISPLAQETSVSLVDLIDLTESLKSAPSLMQQVQDQDVGSYGLDDVIRGAFLIQMGERLVAEVSTPTPTPKPTRATKAISTPGLAEGENIGKNCLLQPSPFDCISAIGSVEGMLAKSKQQRIACDWASGAWLPTYSQLRLAWNYKMMPSPAQSNSLSAIWTLMQQSRPLGC